MIFQDPFGSLNPVKNVDHHIARPLRIHHIVAASEIESAGPRAARDVGLCRREVAAKYPHQLSGGQRQRVAIARALAVEPSVDPGRRADLDARRLDPHRDPEPDAEAEGRARLAFLYVTHDLASARYIADDILVMYAGQIVERARRSRSADPLHPYTQLLLAAVPDPADGERER